MPTSDSYRGFVVYLLIIADASPLKFASNSYHIFENIIKN